MMRLLALSAFLAFVIDQASKWLAFSVLRVGERGRVDVFDPFLVFRPGMNQGINFGLFADGSPGLRITLILIAVALCAMLTFWARRSFTRPVAFVSAGLIVGGALANAWDRVMHPGVLDFINMSCCGLNNPYLFNLADVFIFAGAAGLILFTGDENKNAA